MIASIALLASTTPNALARLEIATPSEAAAAVGICLKAARPGAVDTSQLIAAGWREQSGDKTSGQVFTHPDNAAVLYTMGAPLSGVCWARVRLADSASIDFAGDEIDRMLGLKGQRRAGHLGKFYWRLGNRIVASNGFDDGPGSPPYVIQIGIGEMPKEFR
jgi:hypothetical protein